MADQPYWAGRVANLGIGTAHDGPTPTTESLSAALRTALTPETRARATDVAGTIRTDGRRRPRSCCSTRSAKKGRQPRPEPRGIVEPGKAPGARPTANST
jgi:UDP:flavonoid glycosyltransferase YjiC (YdhE family)